MMVKTQTTLIIALLCLFSSVHAVTLFESPGERKLGLGISLGLAGGGVSVFDLKNFMEYSATMHNYRDDVQGKDVYEGTDAHLHARRFFKKKVGGWYYGGFLHRTVLIGQLKNKHQKVEQVKTGVGLELGYTSRKLFRTKRLYWGAGVGVSHYIGAKETDIFKDDDLLNDSDIGFFLDFLRVGAVF